MNNKSFYLTIKGQKVEVSEEVYRAYVRPIRNEQRKRRRDWRCKIIGQKGNLVRCNQDCSKCSYAKNGKNPNGNALSLERFKDDGFDIEDSSVDLEQYCIEKEETEALYNALSQLTIEQQEIIKLIYFEGKTQDEVAKKLGISQQAVGCRLVVIMKKLKSFLKNF